MQFVPLSYFYNPQPAVYSSRPDRRARSQQHHHDYYVYPGAASVSPSHPRYNYGHHPSTTTMSPLYSNYSYDPEVMAYLARQERQRQIEAAQEEYNRQLMEEYNEALLDRQRHAHRQRQRQHNQRQQPQPQTRMYISPDMSGNAILYSTAPSLGGARQPQLQAQTQTQGQGPEYAASEPQDNETMENKVCAPNAAQTEINGNDNDVNDTIEENETNAKSLGQKRDTEQSHAKSRKSRNHHHKRHKHGKKQQHQHQQHQQEQESRGQTSVNSVLDIIDALFGGPSDNSENPFADLMGGKVSPCEPETTSKFRRQARNEARQAKKSAEKAERQQQRQQPQEDVTMADAVDNSNIGESQQQVDDNASVQSSVLSAEEADAQLQFIAQSYDRCNMTYERLSTTLDKTSALTIDSLGSRIHILNMTQLQLDDIVDKLDGMDEVPADLKPLKHSLITKAVSTADKVERLTSALSEKRNELKDAHAAKEKEELEQARALAAAQQQDSSDASSIAYDSDSDSMDSWPSVISPRPIRKVTVEEVPDDSDF